MAASRPVLLALALAAMGAGCGHSVPSPHDPTAYVYVRDHRTGICFAVAPPQAYGIEVMTSVPCDSIPPTLERP